MNLQHFYAIGIRKIRRTTSNKTTSFRWLAADEDDGQIVRELTLNSAAQHLDKVTYNVRIKTGDVFQAGTDADVYLKIFGETYDTDKIQLRTANNTSNKFERNQIDHFTFEFDDLGKVCVFMLCSFFI